ncbi:DUF2620 family protein [Georgenia sp. Z1491]|uniref:DUF2620 family protein n=1 Tax=Georgenia sp. Z1491 TaxID=3416707 RepID=UPI003CE972BE
MKIIVGGVAKSAVADALKPILRETDSVAVGSDMDAAMKLRSGQADYFLGTCHTGAGASLGVLVGLLGTNKCHTFARRVPTSDDVTAAVESGVQALGFSVDQVEVAAPTIYRALVAHDEGR